MPDSPLPVIDLAPSFGHDPLVVQDVASRIDAALRQPSVRRDTDGEDA